MRDYGKNKEMELKKRGEKKNEYTRRGEMQDIKKSVAVWKWKKERRWEGKKWGNGKEKGKNIMM